MQKKQDGSFFNDSTSYKTGVKTESEDPILVDAKRRAVIKYQMQLEEERHKKRTDRLNKVKEHAIPFGLICTDFKIVFICSLIAFFGNLILSIIYKNILWSNAFNLVAAFVILFISKHVYTKQEDEYESKISEALRRNICQVCSDITNYRLANFFQEKATMITDIISVVSAICFALFSAQNILYSTCAIACLFMIFLLAGLQQFNELKSHLKMLNKSLLIGIFVKAIFSVIFTTKYIQIDYMNVLLLFLFTCIRMWFIDDEMPL